MSRWIIIVLALVSVSTADAAPLIHFAMEGRQRGTNDPFKSELDVSTGDTIEYRLRVQLDPPPRPYEQIPKNSIGSTLHGISSLWLEILQDPHAAIQVDFDSPARLTEDSYPQSGDGWGSGTGARGGVPRLRGDTGLHDLDDIRPIHAAGIFTAREWETVLTGVFEVASVAGLSAQVQGAWRTFYNPSGPRSSGGWYWDGQAYFTNGTIEGGPSPKSDYVPLTLTARALDTVPEPSTIALLATIVGVFGMGRRLRRR